MSIELNHTIVHAKDNLVSAKFFSEVFGLGSPERFYHFQVVRTHNGVSLDFLSTDEEFNVQHYAFLVSEPEFDQIFDRIKAKNVDYFADPMCSQKGMINTNDGGRGCYFKDPSGHVLEIITRPYGG